MISSFFSVPLCVFSVNSVAKNVLARQFFGFIQNFVVVGFLAHFGHQLKILDYAVAVDDVNRARQKSHRGHIQTVALAEGVAFEIRQHLHFADAFGAAPARLSERRVFRNRHADDVIGHFVEGFVKAARLRFAHAGINRRNNRNDADFAIGIGKFDRLHFGVDQIERGRLVADLGRIARKFDRFAFECNCSCHDI